MTAWLPGLLIGAWLLLEVVLAQRQRGAELAGRRR